MLCSAPVNFTSELSSAYNVQGGSFDENLVYVNDIESRPLVRSGQQEGLVCQSRHGGCIEFSAGGFEAKYGDKLSSVLDIVYRKPTGPATRVTASALGAQVQHDNVTGPFKVNLGVRYRNNSYVLSTLDERGEYAPTYLDAQTYITYDPDGYGPWEIQALGVYGRNDYRFFPATRETNIGTINQAARLTVYYAVKSNLVTKRGLGRWPLSEAQKPPDCAGSTRFFKPQSGSRLMSWDNTSSASWSAIPAGTRSTKATPLGWVAFSNMGETPSLQES